MTELEIVVEVAEALPHFQKDRPYQVHALAGERMLLVNDEGRFAWVPADKLAPVSITRGETRIFDRDEFRLRRRYEDFTGQVVLITTWEDLGLPLERRNEEGMLVYRVRVEGFEGNLLMVCGGDNLAERSGIMAAQVYSIEPVDGETPGS
jgi:hypothetical protein